MSDKSEFETHYYLVPSHLMVAAWKFIAAQPGTSETNSLYEALTMCRIHYVDPPTIAHSYYNNTIRALEQARATLLSATAHIETAMQNVKEVTKK